MSEILEQKQEVKTRSSGSEGGHWYNEEGLVTAVPSSDGKKLVAPTIRHAKKLGLLPSVTGVLGILDKPALNLWKCKEYVRAANFVGLKANDESEEDYFAKVREQFNRYNDHAQVGTDIHAEIARYFECGEFAPNASKVCDWLNQTLSEYRNAGIAYKIESEKPFANYEYGFGGTVDFKIISDAQVHFIDFKTTDDDKIPQGAKLAYKDSHLAQLVAYDLGCDISAGKFVRFTNIFIGRLGGEIYVHEWTDEEQIAWAKRYFLAALKLFKIVKGL